MRRSPRSDDELADLLRRKLVDAGALEPDAGLTGAARTALATMLQKVDLETAQVRGTKARSWGAAYALAGRLISGSSVIGRNLELVARLLDRPVADVGRARPRSSTSNWRDALASDRKAPPKGLDTGVFAPVRAIRIGISGAASVGKSAFARALYEQLAGQARGNVQLISGVARTMIVSGRTRDHETSADDYAAYFRAHLENLNRRSTGYMIYDRTFYDTLAYAYANRNLPPDWLELVHEVGRLVAAQFDIYFYIPLEPNVALEEDGIASTDSDYIEEIDRAIEKVLREYLHEFIVIRGDTEERLATALPAIMEVYSKGD